jgi:cyanophycinase-like exopeptidase
MGRLVTFLARMMKDRLTPESDTRGIGVDEETAVIIVGNVASVVGKGTAYFLKPSRGLADAVVQAKQPLVIDGIHVQKVLPDSTPFVLSTWSSGSADQGYFLSAFDGRLLSSQAGGSPY